MWHGLPARENTARMAVPQLRKRTEERRTPAEKQRSLHRG